MADSKTGDGVHQLGDVARRAASEAKHQAERIGEVIADAAETVGHTVKAASSEAVERGEVIVNDIENFIVRRPWVAVAVAAAIGAVIGSLLRPVHVGGNSRGRRW